jgi:hypothetical protein
MAFYIVYLYRWVHQAHLSINVYALAYVWPRTSSPLPPPLFSTSAIVDEWPLLNAFRLLRNWKPTISSALANTRAAIAQPTASPVEPFRRNPLFLSQQNTRLMPPDIAFAALTE